MYVEIRKKYKTNLIYIIQYNIKYKIQNSNSSNFRQIFDIFKV